MSCDIDWIKSTANANLNGKNSWNKHLLLRNYFVFYWKRVAMELNTIAYCIKFCPFVFKNSDLFHFFFFDQKKKPDLFVQPFLDACVIFFLLGMYNLKNDIYITINNLYSHLCAAEHNCTHFYKISKE